MRTRDFDYELPQELIPQIPADQRSASRLLHLDGVSGDLEDRQFADLPQFLKPNDVMVLNNTRVIKARLFGQKESGGRVEILIERVLDDHHVLAQVRASHAPRAGASLILANQLHAIVEERQGGFYRLRFDSKIPVWELLERIGVTPLPPYISRPASLLDEVRYQTVYAREPGAVAAPTAGLHFDLAMLDNLRKRGIRIAFVTLHVGAGTFQPVCVDEISEHRMHNEWYNVPAETVSMIQMAKQQGGRVVAVGSTSLRALEAAAASESLQAGCGETNIFITPGYRFKVVERLLTNFHLPRSTLLMLVSAFGGIENIRHAYRHAVQNRYRFFSYGDAMLIERQL
ncbi:MAG TPA: tRNA preQ1(34) S-adenosylmethionine ribosyltransferase-isomerase QueA [Burkholderiales bacterium]|nr:tRNA preQ1(34) S-adenosylmethionine ribosyltransferase-isomerase QueA [Burkholderiales bacterium]